MLNRLQTSLNMPGFSITLLLLPSLHDADAPDANLLLRLLDDPTSAPGWAWSSGAPAADLASHQAPKQTGTAAAAAKTIALRADDPVAFDSAIKRACAAVNNEEAEITHMDTIAGDGDCGLTLQTGANGEHHALPTLPGFI
jgi:dihydroxyacetone kinase